MDKTIILDTDMVSAFAKIKQLELLYEELTISLEYGYVDG